MLAAGPGSSGKGWYQAVNEARLYAGTNTTATAADSVFHATQGLASGASSVIYVDGTSTSVSAGTNVLAGISGADYLYLGSDNFGDNCDCSFLEGGYFPFGLSTTQMAALNANQHAAYGF
jgi:hypothetical protein